jgi:hypothetical protein
MEYALAVSEKDKIGNDRPKTARPTPLINTQNSGGEEGGGTSLNVIYQNLGC